MMGFDLPFEFDFNLNWIVDLGNKPFYYIFWFFFINGGWIIFLIVILWGLFMIFVGYQQSKFAAKQSYVFLAIDIPKVNVQSPKAVENIFSVIAGTHSSLEWEEKYLQGKFQLGMSLEIVSIDGYIQYVLRVPTPWRDLVEAAFYSQYPDIEITEVEDYTAGLDLTFPNDEYDLWGCDLVLTGPNYLPIRTYPEFEHQMSQEFKDPMLGLLEVMNKCRPGEQIWYQILIYPEGVDWIKEGQNALKKLLGQEVSSPKAEGIDKILELPVTFLNTLAEIVGLSDGAPKKEEKKPQYFMPYNDEIKAKAIARKISKVGFKVKWRIIYLAKKEVFNKALGVSGVIGAIKQFNDLNLNSFKPDKNKTQYRWPWFKNSIINKKKNAIFKFYKKRSADSGSEKFILNIEELATIYHFPVIETYFPKIKRIESKKSKAPVDLPLTIGLPIETVPAVESVKKVKKETPMIDYDNDYFEKRFAKDKSGRTDKIRKEQVLKKLKSEQTIFTAPVTNPLILPDELRERLAKPINIDSENQNEKEKPKNQPPANLPIVN